MKRLICIPVLVFHLFVFAQKTPQTAVKYGLDTLAQSDQITFITDHFYEIYSTGFDDAIELSRYAIELSQTLNVKESEGYAHMCFGMANYLRGNYETALSAYLTSSEIFDSLRHHDGIARLNNELAVFYRKQKKLDKMHACLDKSEAAALQINNLETLATTYHHKGVTLSQNSDYENALPYFEKVLAIRSELKDSVGLGYIYLDLAEYQVHLGQIDQALKLIDKSTGIRQKLGDAQGVAVNEIIKGETMFAAGRYNEAIGYFENTLTLAKPIGYTDLIRYAYDMLQKAHIETGNYQLAYQNLSQSVVFSDSLFSIEKTKSLQELETKYETEKKEQQLALQTAELKTSQAISIGLVGALALLIVIGTMHRNRVVLKHQKELETEKARTREAQIEAALNSQEAERKRFARDLHDGFGQMISVLNLNLKALEQGKRKASEVFEDSSQVLDQMYTELKGICFNLMPETLIKKGIVEGLREFASRVNRTRKASIMIDTFGIDERLSDLQEISIYRITQEWINNILKYSDADKVTVSLTQDEEEITLLIEDNGSGFDKNDLINGNGNGWKNMHSRANLIKGELELDTTAGIRGSSLIVNAPILSQKLTIAQ
ncbi:MAG: tetratricopeptide repeat protein [Cyclobacteriaceae bacterium]